MSRTIFITDGSEAAFYAAVFRAWQCPSAHIDSAKNFQPLITDEIKTVSQTEEETEEQARRFRKSMRAPFPKSAISLQAEIFRKNKSRICI